MILEVKNEIQNIIQDIFNRLNIKDVVVLERPKERLMGDFAIPCFSYAKYLKKDPNEIAKDIAMHIKSDYIEKIEVIGAYVNIFLNKSKITEEVITKIIADKANYGSLSIGKDKTVVLDYSHPNIAKPFGVGHLRSTVIGNSIRKILDKLGYKTIGINYLGDYGTQFGKIIYAYKTWGDLDQIEKNPIEELRKLYVKFHDEVERNPIIEEEGRKYFKKLEEKDPEVLNLWQWIRDISLNSFMETYNLLGITDFDTYEGEASIIDQIEPVIKELEKKGLLEEDEGAKIIKLEDTASPVLIMKNDGTSLYMTRDLAAVFHRANKYNFDEILYVVGNEQTLHFNQLKKVVKLMGYEWFDKINHISFGLILQDGKKMSTRRGKSIRLNEILEEAITLANKYITDKNPKLDNKDEVSRKVGVGAVIFNDLKNYRTSDVEFNFDEILRFEGETSPYIQYTFVRINSLMENIENIESNINNVNISEYIWNIIMKLLMFDEVLLQTKNNYDPSLLAKYVIDLAQDYNKFYGHEKIISDNEEEMQFKLKVSLVTSIVLKEGMRLLGVEMPSRM